jgi:hypothetical protein
MGQYAEENAVESEFEFRESYYTLHLHLLLHLHLHLHLHLPLPFALPTNTPPPPAQLESPASSLVPDSADEVPFALRIFPLTKRIQVLSELECHAIVRQHYAPVSQEDPLPQDPKAVPRSDNAYVNLYHDVVSTCCNSSATTKWGAAAMTCLAPVVAAYWYRAGGAGKRERGRETEGEERVCVRGCVMRCGR